jgi:hypothetical protein
MLCLSSTHWFFVMHDGNAFGAESTHVYRPANTLARGELQISSTNVLLISITSLVLLVPAQISQPLHCALMCAAFQVTLLEATESKLHRAPVCKVRIPATGQGHANLLLGIHLASRRG